MRGCCLSGNFAMKVVKETGRDVPVFLEGSVAIVVTTCVTRLGSTCARLINIYTFSSTLQRQMVADFHRQIIVDSHRKSCIAKH